MELVYDVDTGKVVGKDYFPGLRERASQIFVIESNIESDLKSIIMKRRQATEMIDRLDEIDRMPIGSAQDQKMSRILKKIVVNWKSIESHLNHIKKTVTGVF